VTVSEYEIDTPLAQESLNVVEGLAANASSSDPSAQEDLTTLRAMLLAPQTPINETLYQRLDSLEQRLSDPAQRTEDTSEILVSAVKQKLAADDKLRNTLKPMVVDQFRETAHSEPDMMAEALFPILGPAVRKMISNLLSLDKKKTQSGYRVEQLFLIHSATGLPLCDATSPLASGQDADLVSGMLSAIQSFVQDAFETDEFDGLNTLQLGELSVFIEWGPVAVLAAVVRGVPPKTLRETMVIRNEQIHSLYRTELEAFAGDRSDFDSLTPELLQLIDSYDGSLKNRLKQMPDKSKGYLGVTLLALLACALWIMYSFYDSHRWMQHVETIDALAGVVVTQQERRWDGYSITGLRDPLSVNPADLLTKTSLDPKRVDYRFEPYEALHSDFILERARDALVPPRNAALVFNSGVLYVIGDVDAAWAADARKIVRGMAGVRRLVFRSILGSGLE